MPAAAPLFVNPFRNHEEGQEHRREGRAADRGHLLGQQVQQGREEQHEEHHDQAEGNLHAADVEVQRHLELARAAVLEPQHDHRQGLEDETPHHAEGIGLAQHVHVAAAEHDRQQLQAHDQEQDAVGRAVAAVRLEEPVGHDAVFGHAVQHAVGADDRRVHRAGQDQEADDHHEAVQQPAGPTSGPGMYIASPPIRLSCRVFMRTSSGISSTARKEMLAVSTRL